VKKFGQFTKILLIFTSGLLICCYGVFLFVLPNILSSPDNIHKYETFISKKIGVPLSIKGFEVKTYPDLSFELKSDNIFVTANGKTDLFHADKLKYGAHIFNLKHGHLMANYIYADIDKLKKYIKPAPANKKHFDLTFFPQTNIRGAEIKFNDKNYLDVEYIRSKKHKGKIVTKIVARVYSEYAKEPVLIGKNGIITYQNHLGFEDFSVRFGNSEFTLTGTPLGMKIKGKDIPVHETEGAFLYFYKLKHPNKRNFLENFSDFKGTMDVDLFLDKKGLMGKCFTHNLGAKFSKFKIDVFLPETVFDFKGREVSAQTSGTFGTEPVKTDFHLTGMMTDDLDVTGNVSSVFTDRITKKYFPKVQILGKTPANVKYHTHNTKVDVYYTLTVDKGSNLLSAHGNLDNTDKTRVIKMHTVKNGDPMAIESWEYTVDGKTILSGDGNFEKINGRYALSDLSVKTNGKVGINYIKSFLRDYFKDGGFDANLRISFLKKVLLGNVNLYNVSHGDFLFLKNTKISFMQDVISLLADGSFYSSPIKMSVRAKNRFSDDLLVNSVDIHLKEFAFRPGKFADVGQSFKKDKPKIRENPDDKITYTIEQARVVVDKLSGNKFTLRNVNLQGNVHNEIVSFIIPKADYAHGLLSAKGVYDLAKHSSNMWFYASDIDSNVVMTEFFHLPDQVHGTAYATLHAITRDRFDDVKARATFAITDGYMPQIAEKEIFIGKKRADGTKKGIKLAISKIVNFDFSDVDDYKANIYGSFDLDNENLRNLQMYAKSQWIGLYFEGIYNITSECGDVNIWGKRNKTHLKTIRIFKIPINLIYRLVFKPEHSVSEYEDKIKRIPPINEGIADEISVFRVRVLGYANRKGGLKFEFKDLRE